MLRIVLGGVYGSPPPAKKKYRQYSPSSLTKAYESVIEGDFSVRKASKVFNVPMQTLRDRVIGHVQPETIRSGPGPLLSELEEARLVDHIKDMAKVGYPYTRAEVIHTATEFAQCLGRKVEQSCSPKPSTSGVSKSGGPIDISTPPYHSEDDDDDVDDDDDEKCCVCDKFQPPELASCSSIVFVKWAKCDLCDHWTHLIYYTSVRVIRRGDVFRCPHCENDCL